MAKDQPTASCSSDSDRVGNLDEDTRNSNYIVIDMKEAIAAEHRRLLRTRALLGCLVVALNECYDADENDPDFADVAQLAGQEVQASVDRLEAVLN